MWIAAIVLVMLGLVPGAVNLAAQQPAAAPLAFDVVSVRAAEGPTLTGRGIQIVPGRFRSVDMPLISLILRAYDVAHWRVEGAPGWVGTERFSVDATFPPSATREQVNAMLRTLLETRFRLSVERVTREMDTDLLIVVNRERGLGPGLHPVSVDCSTNELRAGSSPGLFAAMSTRPACGNSIVTAFFVPGDASSFRHVGARRYAAITMADLADRLSSGRGRAVLDRTGLSGQYDVALEYASEMAPAASLERASASTPDTAPPLQVALEEQLGLRLRRERNDVEVLVVRSVERPRPDEN